MANLCDEFEIFHNRIKLSAYRQVALGLVRDAIRQRIRTFFRYILNARAPKFWSQGPFAVKTTVNPVTGMHHIEDGVYLQNLDKRNMAAWPSADEVHRWITDAVQGGATPYQGGNSTVVQLCSACQYRIDLHCYADLHGRYFRAIKGGVNWSGIHPLAITGWFRSYVNQRGNQLRRIVRYLTAWADYQSSYRGQMPDELFLMVLATYSFQRDCRDDKALAMTLKVICDYIRSIVYVLNPVDIREELSARLTEAQKTRFKEAVQEAADMANDAVIISDAHKALELWRKQLGGRFPFVQK